MIIILLIITIIIILKYNFKIYNAQNNQMRAKNKYITGKTNNLLLTNVISKQIIFFMQTI